MSAPSSEDLWPSLDESLGRQPCFPSGSVWSVLPTLKGQMSDMLTEMKHLHPCERTMVQMYFELQDTFFKWQECCEDGVEPTDGR